jgi:hypothetical protein
MILLNFGGCREDLYVRGYMRPLQNEAPHSDCASRHQPTVEKLFDVHRELDVSELEHCLLGLDVGMPCSPSFVPS